MAKKARVRWYKYKYMGLDKLKKKKKKKKKKTLVFYLLSYMCIYL